MKRIVVQQFGGPEELTIETTDTPEPGPSEVRVRTTSIGLNHAELMARNGAYRLLSGEPPFVPGLEAGGIIETIGDQVTDWQPGQRVILSPRAPRLPGNVTPGTYRTHCIVPADQILELPDAVPDEQAGALWLAYFTAWGCLVHRQQISEWQWVALPAASSSVALAAAQIVKARGGITVGLTSSPDKVEKLNALETARYDHLIVTHEPDRSVKKWHREIRDLTEGRGIDVFFDPVAAGPYLSSEVKSLATHGTLWIYGLLGGTGEVDLTPLIRKRAAIRGYVNDDLLEDDQCWRAGCAQLLEGFADGTYQQAIGGRFAFDDVQQAHRAMEQAGHIGKLVLLP